MECLRNQNFWKQNLFIFPNSWPYSYILIYCGVEIWCDFTNIWICLIFLGRNIKLQKLCIRMWIRIPRRALVPCEVLPVQMMHTVNNQPTLNTGMRAGRWREGEMHRKDQSTASSVVRGRLRACCWEIGLYLSASRCFTVYRSLTGLWNCPHRTGRKRSVTGHRLKPHQKTPALRRRAVSWVRHSPLHKHTYFQRERGRRELTVYITGNDKW